MSVSLVPAPVGRAAGEPQWKQARYHQRSHGTDRTGTPAGISKRSTASACLGTGGTGGTGLTGATGGTGGTGPSGPADYRANTVTMASGTSSVAVTFSTPLPSATYSAHLQVSSTTTAWENNVCTANDNGCWYFNVANKTVNGFTIELRRPSTGALMNATTNVNIDYFAI